MSSQVQSSSAPSIRPGTQSSLEAGGILRSTSSWLRRFPVPTQIIELYPQPGEPISEFTFSALSKADITIIVCSPLTTSLGAACQHLPFLFQNSNAILVLTSTTTLTPELSTHISSLLSNTCENGLPQVLTIDPFRALAALRALRVDSTSSASVQRYQDHFIGSHISTLTDAIWDILKYAQRHMGLDQIRRSLTACNHSLHCAENEIGLVSSGISELLGKVEEARVKVPADVFGGIVGDGSDIVTGALMEGRRKMETVMDGLTWWRSLWQVDEIGAVISTAVEKALCRELEKMVSPPECRF
jgi:hypothetical protein